MFKPFAFTKELCVPCFPSWFFLGSSPNRHCRFLLSKYEGIMVSIASSLMVAVSVAVMLGRQAGVWDTTLRPPPEPPVLAWNKLATYLQIDSRIELDATSAVCAI